MNSLFACCCCRACSARRRYSSLRVSSCERELDLTKVLVVMKTSRFEYERRAHPELTEAQLSEVRTFIARIASGGVLVAYRGH
jgi:hypothetical protein